MGGVKRSKQTLNAKEAPCLPRKLAMRGGDHLQALRQAPPRLCSGLAARKLTMFARDFTALSRVTYSVGCKCAPFIMCSLDFLDSRD
jgi:hypothetical protein